MMPYSMILKYLYIVLTVVCTGTSLNAQKIKPPFDVNDIVKQVSTHHHPRESREGEFLIDTNLVYVAAADDQIGASVAFDGTNYLIVWTDFRYSWQNTIWGADIYGARVSTAGLILDLAGIAISTSAYWQQYPSVAFDGSNYLVVWQESRADYDIFGARVSPSGILLDTSGFAISTAADNQWHPAVAFDGTNYLVTWDDMRSGVNDIYGTRVDTSGTVLDSMGITISRAQNIQRHPSVTFDGSNCLVVWEDARSGSFDIFGARVDTSGIVLDSAGIAISAAQNGQYYPSVSFDGTHYFVAWEDLRNNSYSDIYAARVDTSGIVLDSAGIAISTTTWNKSMPSIAFDGTNYLIAWTDNRAWPSDIYGSRVTSEGIVLDSSGIVISSAVERQLFSSIGYDGSNYFVAWHDFRNNPPDIYGTRMDTSGTVLDTSGIIVSTQAYDQYDAAVAFDGTNYFVTFTDGRNDSYDIFGVRIDQTGVIIDTAGIAISATAGDQLYPSVIFGGNNYLVVWQDFRNDTFDIYGARMDQSGALLDTSGIAISTAEGDQIYPSLSFDGTNYLVVWEDHRGFASDIYGARIDQEGVLLDSLGIAITTAIDQQWHPSVAFDGTNYLVVWEDQRNASFSDAYGARVNQSGIVMDSNGIAISTAEYRQSRPTVAFDGENYFVVWQDSRGILAWDIYGTRVTTSGIVLDTNDIPISVSINWQYFPALAFDGSNYLVIWQDDQNGYFSDIYGAQVSTSGAVIDSFAVAIQKGRQSSAAVMHGTGNQLLITYASWTDSINTHPANTIRIWGKFYPFVGVEEETQHLTLDAVRLLHVYPNPTRKECNIRYTLSNNCSMNLSLYDVTGRLIKNIINDTQNAGVYHTKCSMTDLPQGIYFVRLSTDDYSAIKKAILIK